VIAAQAAQTQHEGINFAAAERALLEIETD
jgi:hypothetical protein